MPIRLATLSLPAVALSALSWTALAAPAHPAPAPAASDPTSPRAGGVPPRNTVHATSGRDPVPEPANPPVAKDSEGQPAREGVDEEPQPADDFETSAVAEEAPEEVVVVEGQSVQRHAGSVHVLDERQLERFEQDDIHQVVRNVPGVYVRGEDGFGLRPNIGMRGVNPERSKKIVLMEDGVLFGPAPYSAPAAYYFPMVSRMSRVEVLKGPGAVLYGPNSIGGALNLHSTPIPDSPQLRSDFAAGSFGYGKGHLRYGMSTERIGYVLEGLHVQSSGFKQLDGEGNTGFARSEGMLKWRVNSGLDAEVYQELELKLGLSVENSRETYLGLTDEDFRQSPYRRYRASARDQMQWHRSQVELRHKVEWLQGITLNSVVYRHDFTRGWDKLNRLDGASIPVALDNPDYYQVLTGDQDSVGGNFGDQALVGLNHRQFVSQGVQSTLVMHGDWWGIGQRLHMGARLHNDSIRRRHSETPYLMTAGELQRTPGAVESTVADNQGDTTAVAVFAKNELEWGQLLLSPGARVEWIWTQFNNQLGNEGSGSTEQALQWAVLPGIGAFYQVNEWMGALAGAYRGFSPAAPQAGISSSPPEPEQSINYELGARFTSRPFRLELIGFLNDYSNLTRTCGRSTGCDDALIDRQFSAGEVSVYGIELMVEGTPSIGKDLKAPLRAAYTLTRSQFQGNFTSEDPTLGEVSAGDELPYLPSHQLSLGAGVEVPGRWGVDINSLYVSALREEAGSGETTEMPLTDEQWLVGIAGRWHMGSHAKFYGTVTNLLGNEAIVARRPFGARPIAPRAVQLGVQLTY